jgi:hypothetical protein
MRRGRRSVAAILLMASAACLWRGYERIVAVHVDVLASVAAKMRAKSAAGTRPSASDVTEMLYPLHRARQFARQYDAYAARESYRRFTELTDRYDTLTRLIDANRGDPARWQAAQAALHAAADAVQAGAERVRAALAPERR